MRFGSVLLIAIMVGLALVAPASAQNLGNPSYLLKKGQFGVGVEGYYLAEQKYKQKDSYDSTLTTWRRGEGVSSRDTTVSDNPIELKVKDDQFYMASLAYGLFDRLTFFVKLGVVTGGKLEMTGYSDGQAITASSKMKSNFVWAVGGKGKIYEFSPGGPGFVGSVQYLRYDDRKVDWPYEEGNWTTMDNKTNYWQVDVAASFYWPFEKITPYVGAAYSYAKQEYKWNEQLNTDLNQVPGLVSFEFNSNIDYTSETKNQFMPFGGLNAQLGDSFMLDLQGTFLARFGASLSLSYLF